MPSSNAKLVRQYIGRSSQCELPFSCATRSTHDPKHGFERPEWYFACTVFCCKSARKDSYCHWLIEVRTSQHTDREYGTDSTRRGIGAGIAAELGRRGANVVLNFVTDRGAQAVDKLTAAIKSAGGNAVAVKGSVSENSVRHELVKAAIQLSPSKDIDMLVHNAGNGDDKYLVDLDEDFFDMQVSINLKGTGKARPHLL